MPSSTGMHYVQCQTIQRSASEREREREFLIRTHRTYTVQQNPDRFFQYTVLVIKVFKNDNFLPWAPKCSFEAFCVSISDISWVLLDSSTFELRTYVRTQCNPVACNPVLHSTVAEPVLVRTVSLARVCVLKLHVWVAC